MPPIAFLDFGFSELILVGVVALLVFGGNLPDVMRTLGRNYAKLRQTLREFSAPVRDEINRVRDMPSPEGIVSQELEGEDPAYPDGELDPDDDMDPDGDVPEIRSTAEGAASDPRKPSTPPKGGDLLDEGPLV